MSLDPDSGSAVKNALAELANWGAKLSKEGHYESALEYEPARRALVERRVQHFHATYPAGRWEEIADREKAARFEREAREAERKSQESSWYWAVPLVLAGIAAAIFVARRRRLTKP